MKKKMIKPILIMAITAVAVTGCAKKTSEAEKTTPVGTAEEAAGENEETSEAAKETPEEQVDYEMIYRPMLDACYNLLDMGAEAYSESGASTEGMTGIEEISMALAEEAAYHVGYVYKDINGDDVPELLVGGIDGDDEEHPVCKFISAAYTIVDGEPVQILEGWGRNSYVLLDDGRLFMQGSGGAAYACYGIYKADAKRGLICEEFVFTNEKDDNFDDIRVYRNTTGDWDPDSSEELKELPDAMYDRKDGYVNKAQLLPVTRLAYYPDTKLIVTAHETEDVMLSDAEYVTLDDSEWQSKVIFSAKEDVEEFKIIGISILDLTEDGRLIYDETSVFEKDVLETGKPLVATMAFAGDIPNYILSYRVDDVVYQYLIGQSGKDGSVTLTAF